MVCRANDVPWSAREVLKELKDDGHAADSRFSNFQIRLNREEGKARHGPKKGREKARPSPQGRRRRSGPAQKEGRCCMIDFFDMHFCEQIRMFSNVLTVRFSRSDEE